MNQPLIYVGTLQLYAVLAITIGIILSIDFYLLKKQGAHRMPTKEALKWTLVWFACASLFGLWLYYQLRINPLTSSVAIEKTIEYFTAYFLEQSLSIDNIFVFILIFNFFQIPDKYQHKILLYGVLTAIVLRIMMIFLGVALVTKFDWILYIFGAFLLFSGLKMLWSDENEQKNLADNPFYKILVKIIPMKVSHHLDGEKFITKINNSIYITPLLMALLMIECSDIVFAVDSIPAVFGVTTDPFIIAASNLFAIMGLRALYFLLANIIDKFHYLKYGLAAVLIFIGIKMLTTAWLHIPILISLALIVLFIGGSIVLSLIMNKKNNIKLN